MAYAMTKQGSRDNVLTYEFMCDTIADMNAIEKKYKTLGSVAIVLQGESGLEIYICGSDRQWNAMNVGSGSSGGSGADIDLSDYLQKSDIAAWAKAAQKPTYTAQEVGAATTADISAAIAQINTLQLHVCTQQEVSSGLPDIAEPDAGTIYLVASGNETGNLYEEFVWVSDAWEKIGAAGIDLSTYATKAEVPNRLSEMTNDLIYTQEPAAVTPVETTIYASNADSMIVIKDRTGKGITRTATHDVSNEEQGNNVIFTYTVNNLTLKTGEVASYQWYYSTDGGENWTIIENETTNTHTHIFSMEMWARSWKVEVTIDVQKIILDDLTWNGLTIQKNASTAYNDMYVLGRSSMGSSEIRLYRANSNPGMYSVVCYDHDSYLKSNTPSSSDDSTKVATTAWVNANAHGAEIFDTLDPDMWTDWVASTSYAVGAKVRILDANEVAHGYICKTANENAEFDSTNWDEATVFPASGSANKVYIAKDTQQAYYWNGSSYMPLYDTEKATIANPVFTGSISLGRSSNGNVGTNSYAVGTDVIAGYPDSHAEGTGSATAVTYTTYQNQNSRTTATTSSIVPGAYSNAGHAEGYKTYVGGSSGLHAEGSMTLAMGGSGCHAEGQNTMASGGGGSHAEGYGTYAVGAQGEHAEGIQTYASGGGGCHAEGKFSVASAAQASHAEGLGTKAYGQGSHSEGQYTYAPGDAAHAEGKSTDGGKRTIVINGTQYTANYGANGVASHAEGEYTSANYEASHAEGISTWANSQCAHAEGSYSMATGSYSHAEGRSTYAMGNASHAEGEKNSDTTILNNTTYNIGARGAAAHSEGYNTGALGPESHAEGMTTVAASIASHSEGSYTLAASNYSHSEGYFTKALNDAAHAEGQNTTASGYYAHAEGNNTTASGTESHAEGYATQATAADSHAEGIYTLAVAGGAHAEGYSTEARGSYSHAEGYGTVAYGDYTHVGGIYNISDIANYPNWAANTVYEENDIVQYDNKRYKCTTAHTSSSTFIQNNWDRIYKLEYAEIIGNGLDGTHYRSNARALTWTGDERLAGDVYVHCNNDSTGGTKLATVNDVEAMATRIAELESQVTSLMNALKLLNIPEDNVQGTDGTPITDEALNYLEFDKPTT